MTAGACVQYGCGFSSPRNWRNFDSSPTLRFERIPLIGMLYTKNAQRFPKNVEYGDIVAGLPVADDSCRLVYCSHVLEHLALEDLRTALRNTHRILKTGGRFRLVLPDLEQLVDEYLHNASDDAALEFMRNAVLGREQKTRTIRGFVVDWLGSSPHLWMWDFKSLRIELRSAGFREVRRAEFGDSKETAFADVEDPDRWRNCLGIECEK